MRHCRRRLVPQAGAAAVVLAINIVGQVESLLVGGTCTCGDGGCGQQVVVMVQIDRCDAR